MRAPDPSDRAIPAAATAGLATALVAWSLAANLGLGETGYVGRNLALTAVLVVVAVRWWGLTWRELGLARGSLPRGLAWGVAAATVVAVVLWVGVVLADRLAIVAALLADQRAQLSPAALRHHALVRIPLGTAVFEEVAFRGVLFAAWARQGVRRAVVGTSLVFGLWHIAPTLVALELNGVAVTSPAGLGAIVGAVVVTAVAGVLFAGLRVGSGSLLAPILAHWATNALGLLAAASTLP